MTSLKDLLDASFASWVRTVVDDIERTASMEHFIEESIANEWTYRENGRLEML